MDNFLCCRIFAAQALITRIGLPSRVRNLSCASPRTSHVAAARKGIAGMVMPGMVMGDVSTDSRGTVRLTAVQGKQRHCWNNTTFARWGTELPLVVRHLQQQCPLAAHEIRGSLFFCEVVADLQLAAAESVDGRVAFAFVGTVFTDDVHTPLSAVSVTGSRVRNSGAAQAVKRMRTAVKNMVCTVFMFYLWFSRVWVWGSAQIQCWRRACPAPALGRPGAITGAACTGTFVLANGGSSTVKRRQHRGGSGQRFARASPR